MNTEFKGTPGSWQIRKSESKQAYNVVGTKLGGKWKIARCPATVYNMPDLDEKGMIEAKANALLVSCAPDMLESLLSIKQALDDLWQRDDKNIVFDYIDGSMVDDIILKATTL
jgi:hypothetical protein